MPHSAFPLRFPNRATMLADETSPDYSQHKTSDSQAVVVYAVPATDVNDAVKEILGYSVRQVSGSSAFLIRYLPLKHPTVEGFWAVACPKVYFRGVPGAPQQRSAKQPPYANYSVADYRGRGLSALIVVVFSTLPYTVCDYAPGGGSELDNLFAGLPTTGSYYQWATSGERLQVAVPNLYNPLTNPTPTYPALEYLRFVEKTESPQVEFLDLGQGTLKYAQGHDYGGGVTLPLNNTALPFGMKQRLYRSELTWRWVDVPHKGLFDQFGNLNQNIQDCVGKVNQLDWWGRPKGTLLVLPPKIVTRVPPVDPVLLGFNTANGESGKSYDVIFNANYFDPPWDRNATPVDNCPTPLAPNYRGHNLVPVRPVPGLVVSIAPFWMLATRNGLVAPTDATGSRSAGGNCIYPYVPFANLFTLSTT